ncbi:protein of unknown function [Ectopseudomonas oleovorans]|nr:protein of unknown function [Pseudomonas oleovorans]
MRDGTRAGLSRPRAFCTSGKTSAAAPGDVRLRRAGAFLVELPITCPPAGTLSIAAEGTGAGFNCTDRRCIKNPS